MFWGVGNSREVGEPEQDRTLRSLQVRHRRQLAGILGRFERAGQYDLTRMDRADDGCRTRRASPRRADRVRIGSCTCATALVVPVGQRSEEFATWSNAARRRARVVRHVRRSSPRAPSRPRRHRDPRGSRLRGSALQSTSTPRRPARQRNFAAARSAPHVDCRWARSSGAAPSSSLRPCRASRRRDERAPPPRPSPTGHWPNAQWINAGPCRGDHAIDRIGDLRGRQGCRASSVGIET